MINTISKTLGAQEKTQDIKQSPSTKIATKPYARSRRNELTEVTGLWQERPDAGRGDRTLAEATGRWTGRWSCDSADRRPDAGPNAGGNRPDVASQCPIKYREVPERRNCDQTCPVVGDRTLAASDQYFTASMVGTTERVRSGRFQRPVSSRKAGFHPQRLLSQWGL